MARRTALSTRERAGGEVEELQKTQQQKKSRTVKIVCNVSRSEAEPRGFVRACCIFDQLFDRYFPYFLFRFEN